ncbi:unnamed protein product [Lactuca saligna]|uniref:Uncharacterized protein n=1 Tax=Lactuca saligna TaxID=75948 RepID=A0AA36ENX7_LACSI|nr:unnamed protein product [Lactuca saligna]
MVNFNMHTMTSFSHMLVSSTKIPMLIPKYYNQWVDHMEDYLNGLDEELWDCIDGNNLPPRNVQNIGSFATSQTVNDHTERLKKNEKICMRELRGALPPVVYNYVRSWELSSIIPRAPLDLHRVHQLITYSIQVLRSD